MLLARLTPAICFLLPTLGALLQKIKNIISRNKLQARHFKLSGKSAMKMNAQDHVMIK